MKANRFSLLIIGVIFVVIVIIAVFFLRQPSESEPTYEKSAYEGFAFIIEVNCPVEKAKNEMESYLKSELRRLGDVEINKGYATHVLYIDAIYTDLFKGNMAISYVFVENHVTGLILKGRQLINYTPNIQKLSDVCKDMIIGIDVHFLEPIREGE